MLNVDHTGPLAVEFRRRHMAYCNMPPSFNTTTCRPNVLQDHQVGKGPVIYPLILYSR